MKNMYGPDIQYRLGHLKWPSLYNNSAKMIYGIDGEMNCLDSF